MNIVIVGLNHRTAPIEIREKLCFPAEVVGAALKSLTNDYAVNEAVIISTCNRVEIIGVSDNMEKCAWDTKRFLSDYHSIPLEELDEHLYVHTGADAVKHTFRVAAGLDSMVLGEPQILGQVKDAYGHAVNNNTAGIIINKLSHKAFSVAKRIRTETKIGASAVSISFAAVELAKKIFGELSNKTAMLVGAGEMAELAAKHLLKSGVKKIFVANRTYERAVNMAREFDGTPIMFREFPHHMKEVDIIIASTAAPKFIISPDDIAEAMNERKNKPMFFIDISVPRNIDPLVNNLDNAYVYDIDDLQGVVEANMRERKNEAKEAEAIVLSEIESFHRWVKSLDVVPTIIALRQNLERIGKNELERVVAEFENITDKERKALSSMTTAIINKVLHAPIMHLKKESNGVDGDRLIDVTRRLFDLEDEEAIVKSKKVNED